MSAQLCPRCRERPLAKLSRFCAVCTEQHRRKNPQRWGWDGDKSKPKAVAIDQSKLKTRTLSDMSPEEQAAMRRLYERKGG